MTAKIRHQNKLIKDEPSIYEESIHVLRKYEPKDEGYRVAFSGGKDSIVCYHLCKEAGVKFQAYYSVTTIDPPEVTKFIREYYPDVIWEYPHDKEGNRLNFYQLVAKKGLPTRMRRWCCEILKEGNGAGHTTVLGVRHEESTRRANRQFYEELKIKGGKLVCPIIKWSSTDVWDFIKSRGLPYPSLYDDGYKRLGCRFCPMACRASKIRDMKKYPAMLKTITKYFAIYINNHKDSEKLQYLVDKYNTPENIVKYWWILEAPLESAKGQCLAGFIGGIEGNEDKNE